MVLAAVLALAAWDAWRGDLPASAGSAPPGADAAPRVGAGRTAEALARPERDPFRYGRPDRAAGAPAGVERREEQERPVATPEPPAAVRLVGFIRQGDELRAALSVLGRVALVAEGETVEGVTVLGVEQDEGVRVRLPDDSERELRLPPR